jgi:hypothetical protein
MIKIILPLSRIKDNQICYKITGSKPYTVKRTINIDNQKFECSHGGAFLCDNSGFIKSYSASEEFLILCENLEELFSFFPEREFS